MASERRTCVAWVAGLIVTLSFAARASDPATLVFFNGFVVPMTAQGVVDEAIAVRGDRILAVGTTDEILALAGPTTGVIDLAGRAVYPGFIDAHAHLLRDCGNAGLTIAEAQALALSFGVTSAAEMVVEPGDVERYAAAGERGEIRVRETLFLAYNNLCGDVHGPWYKAYEPFAEIAPRLAIGGVKVFVERSSCGTERPTISFSDAIRPLLSPAGTFWYGDDRPLFSVDELAAVLDEAAGFGLPVAMHAIGDSAVEAALRALLAVGERAETLRPLLLHNLFVRDDLLPLYAQTGATPVVEPVNACFVDTYDDMLPAALSSMVRRWGDLAESAPHTAAGSDWPWCDPGGLSPLFRLANLISTTNQSPAYSSWEPCGPLSEHQIVSAWHALQMMTSEAAYALHAEDSVGTLEAGKLADLVVLSANPLTIPTSEWGQLRVSMTILGGRIEWRDRPDASKQ